MLATFPVEKLMGFIGTQTSHSRNRKSFAE